MQVLCIQGCCSEALKGKQDWRIPDRSSDALLQGPGMSDLLDEAAACANALSELWANSELDAVGWGASEAMAWSSQLSAGSPFSSS